MSRICGYVIRCQRTKTIHDKKSEEIVRFFPALLRSEAKLVGYFGRSACGFAFPRISQRFYLIHVSSLHAPNQNPLKYHEMLHLNRN